MPMLNIKRLCNFVTVWKTMNNSYEFFSDLLYQLFDILLLWYFKCTRQKEKGGRQQRPCHKAGSRQNWGKDEEQVMERLAGTLRKHILPIRDQAWGWTAIERQFQAQLNHVCTTFFHISPAEATSIERGWRLKLWANEDGFLVEQEKTDAGGMH